MKKALNLILIGIFFLVFAVGVYAYGSGATGYSQTGCTPCHGNSPDVQTTVTVTGLPSQYVLGETYPLIINVTSTSVLGNFGGFDLSVTAGTLSTADPNAQIIEGEATHKNNNARSWQINWTAPTEAGVVSLYVAGLASDGTGTGGDKFATNSYSVTPESPTGNLLPTAYFNYTRFGMTLDFKDQSSDEDGNILFWQWDFGDGSSSNLTNPSHTFTAVGRYTVTLTVTDNQNGKNTKSQIILIPSKEEVFQLWTTQILIGSTIIVFTILFAIRIATSRKTNERKTPASKEEEKPTEQYV